MRRAIIVTASTVVGVSSVLAYQPNSEMATTVLDLAGVSTNTAVTTATTTTQAETTPATAPAAAKAKPKSTATTKTSKAKTTTTKKQSKPKPATTQASQPTQTSEATTAQPAPTAQPTQPAAPANTTRMLTGDAYSAVHGFSNYGQVVVTLTMNGNKMTDISVSQSRYGNGDWIRAVRQYLIPAVLQAQNPNVGYVSGATATSNAFIKSLQSALNKA